LLKEAFDRHSLQLIESTFFPAIGLIEYWQGSMGVNLSFLLFLSWNIFKNFAVNFKYPSGGLKMRGFVITPILFVGIFLVSGLMLLNFITLDSNMRDSIAFESRLRNLDNGLMEEKTTIGTSLLFYAAKEAPWVANQDELEAGISSKMGSPVTVWGCGPDYFKVNYTGNFYRSEEDMEINQTYIVTKDITCPIILEIGKNNASFTCNPYTITCTV
jgi:hypothetical protein